MGEPRDLRRILHHEVGLETTDRVWPIIERELPTLLQSVRDSDGATVALRGEVDRLKGIEATHESLRLAARVLVDELHDAWWVRAAGALRALESSITPLPLVDADEALAAELRTSAAAAGVRDRPAASGGQA